MDNTTGKRLLQKRPILHNAGALHDLLIGSQRARLFGRLLHPVHGIGVIRLRLMFHTHIEAHGCLEPQHWSPGISRVKLWQAGRQL